MNTADKISEFLTRAETRSAPSKLDAYYELIRGLRQRRWTYQEIAAVLRDEFTVSAAPSTIHAFLRVRIERREVPHSRDANAPAATVTPKKPRFSLDA